MGRLSIKARGSRAENAELAPSNHDVKIGVAEIGTSAGSRSSSTETSKCGRKDRRASVSSLPLMLLSLNADMSGRQCGPGYDGKESRRLVAELNADLCVFRAVEAYFSDSQLKLFRSATPIA